MNKKELRKILFNKYKGKCAYCGCELKKGWHIDHIEPVVRIREWNKEKREFIFKGEFEKPENENIDNLNPSCASCNIQKNSYTLEQFRDNIIKFVDSLNLYSTQYKFAKRYGLIEETNNSFKFYFENFE